MRGLNALKILCILTCVSCPFHCLELCIETGLTSKSNIAQSNKTHSKPAEESLILEALGAYDIISLDACAGAGRSGREVSPSEALPLRLDLRRSQEGAWNCWYRY